ncbi:MAG: hypothetical protein QOG90_1342 [Actinomycetota bacterium]|jgi:uncharacterized membrane protein
MKRLALVAAAVASMLGLGFLVAPSAHAATTTCNGIRVHLQISGSDIVNLCLPGDLGL